MCTSGAIVLGTFVTFWVAENVLHVSGVLGTVVYGVQTARTSFLAFGEESHHANHAFWHEVGYVATAMIFFLAGVISEHKVYEFLSFHVPMYGAFCSVPPVSEVEYIAV